MASSLAAIILLASIAWYVVNNHVRQHANADVADDLAHAQTIFDRLRFLQHEALLERAKSLASYPGLGEAVAARDSAGVSERMRSHLGDGGCGFVATLHGELLGSSFMPGMCSSPTVGVSWARETARRGSYSGLWRNHGSLYEIEAVPIRGASGSPIGVVGIGAPVDVKRIELLATASVASLTIVYDDATVGAGRWLSSEDLGTVIAAAGPVRLPQHDLLAEAIPLSGQGNSEQGVAILGVDTSHADALLRTLNSAILVVASVAIALVLAVSLMVGNRIVRLLQTYAQRLDDIRLKGDLGRIVEIPDSPELAGFAESYNAVAQEIAHLNGALRDSHFAVLWALVDALEMKDPYTGGHARRVCDLALELGHELALPKSDLDALRQAALLHDVGKIGVPDKVLTKPGPLTDVEFAAVRQHPVWGATILRHAGHLMDLLPAILHHHERFDGKGYPEALSGDRIPLLARIIAIADAYDAMTSDRSYRPRMSFAEGLQHIYEEAGTQFDPRLATLFHDLMQRNTSLRPRLPRAA